MSPKSLLELCLDIHMHHTGASDPLPEYEKDVRVLVYRLESWQTNPHKQFANFDNAVKELVKATLNEAAELKNEQRSKRL